MMYIYHLFILYFSTLVLLPSIGYCAIEKNTSSVEQSCNDDPCSEDACDDTSDKCSPFCGQPGCGIVICEKITQNTWFVDLQEKEFKFIVVNDYQIKKISSLIWHPPKY